MSETAPGQAMVARHAIFDRHQRVVAYELNYHRDTQLDRMLATDPDASSEIILNTYTSISDQGEVKRVPAFIPLPLEMVLGASMPSLPAKQVVFQLQVPRTPGPEYLEAVTRLSQEGYRVAVEIPGHAPELDPLLKVVQIARLDVSLLSAAQIREQVAALNAHRVALLASHIQTVEQLEDCVEAGFRLFEGAFLSRPKVIHGRRIGANQVALMQLIQELQKPHTRPEVLEEMIIRDPVLTYKLLRIVNSAAYSLVRKVESVAEAVVLLGIDQVRKWTTLIAMTNQQDKPEELSRTLLVRGRMSELIAEGERRPNPAAYFMTGMMSGLHVLLDVDQATLLQQVPLGDDIKQAISAFEGPMGQVLYQVIAYESGDWEKLPKNFNIDLFESAYRRSLHWAREAMQAMHQ